RPHVEDHDVVRQLVLGNAGNPAGLFERVQLLSAYPARGAYNPRHSISAAMAGGTRLTIGAPSAASLRTSLDEIGIGSIWKNSTRSGRRSSDRTWSSFSRGKPGRVA